MDLEQSLHALFRCTAFKNSFHVIANDEMKFIQFVNLPKAIIQNVQDGEKPGIHWVAYFVRELPRGQEDTDGNRIIWDFFDSYGKTPDFYPLNTPPGRMCSFNENVFQSPFSSLCGHFCIYFLYNRANGIFFSRILQLLSEGKGKYGAERVVKRFTESVSYFKERRAKVCARNQACCTRAKNNYDFLKKYGFKKMLIRIHKQ